MFNDLVEQIVSILRYIASPAVGLMVVFLADSKHGLLRAVAAETWPWSTPPSSWLIAGFLAVIGVAVYFIHRTLFHVLITKLFVKRHACKCCPDLTPDALAFARWERRGAAEHTNQQSVQSVLDESNAAIHFFYCSGWSALLLAVIVRSVFPANFNPTILSWIVFAGIVAGFVVTALIGDSRTARLDIEAYHRFAKHPSGDSGV